MKTTIKQLTVGITTSTIKMEHSSSFDSSSITDELQAIAILLGGYNMFGRKIPLKIWEPIRDQFSEILEAVKLLK